MSDAEVLDRLRALAATPGASMLVPAAVAAATVHTAIPLPQLLDVLEQGPPREPAVSSRTLTKLVKLIRLSGVSPTQAATYIVTVHQVPSMQLLSEEQMTDLIERYRVLGPQVGPEQFAQDVRSTVSV